MVTRDIGCEWSVRKNVGDVDVSDVMCEGEWCGGMWCRMWWHVMSNASDVSREMWVMWSGTWVMYCVNVNDVCGPISRMFWRVPRVGVPQNNCFIIIPTPLTGGDVAHMYGTFWGVIYLKICPVHFFRLSLEKCTVHILRYPWYIKGKCTCTFFRYQKFKPQNVHGTFWGPT